MTEEKRIPRPEPDFSHRCMRSPNGYQGVMAEEAERGYASQTPRKRVASTTAQPPQNGPAILVAQDCDECGGSGRDPGALSPWEAEACSTCHGSGTQLVERNFLAEAFRIAAGDSHRAPEPEHVKAVVEHCRKLASAALTLPEVA